ncbi:amidohydrolase family protein [Erwinia tasmaniensis]|uniref:amidohydrolase family protein n=1 Tax=Erwinia tasmaniensis TaxID=338565 RepID=UPI003A4E0E0B
MPLLPRLLLSALLLTSLLATVKAVEPPSSLLIKNGYVMSMRAGEADRENTDVLIRGDTIAAIGKNLHAADARVIDATGKFVLPGFVDAHSHLWITTLRGQFRNRDGKFFPVSNRLGAVMKPDDIYTAMYTGAIEQLASGITTSSDFFDNIHGPAAGDAGYRALNDAGIRAIMFYGGPDKTLATPIDLTHLKQLMAKPHDRLLPGLAWRLPRDLHDEAAWTLRDREYAFARDNHLPLQVHVSGEADAMFNALIQRHYLAPFVTVVHATQATPAQLNALEKAGGSLALTPISEERVGYGLTRYDQFKGVTRQGLGLDGNALAGSANMFATLRLAALTQSGATQDETGPDPRRLLELATRRSADAAGLGRITGTIEVGKRADIQIINPDALNMSGFGGGDPASLIVYSAEPENVDTVVVDGRILKLSGQMQHTNITALVARANASARHLREDAAK